MNVLTYQVSSVRMTGHGSNRSTTVERDSAEIVSERVFLALEQQCTALERRAVGGVVFLCLVDWYGTTYRYAMAETILKENAGFVAGAMAELFGSQPSSALPRELSTIGTWDFE